MLGESADMILGDGKVAAWQPDLNLQPYAYYLVRKISRDDFVAFLQHLDWLVESAQGADAIWLLPNGVHLDGWAPDAALQGQGLQAAGTLGAAGVWLRWHDQKMLAVVMASGP